jgi:Ca2+-binding RTX toxin-like protein
MVNVQDLGIGKGRYFLTYTGDDGVNRLVVTRDGPTFTLTDTVGTTTPGLNCEAASATSVQCEAPGGGVVEVAQYFGEDGDDRLEVAFTGRSDGGAMQNNLGGGDDADTLVGSRGRQDHDSIGGGPAGDIVKARAGDDNLVESGRDPSDPPPALSEVNRLSGGAGDDRLAPGAAFDEVKGGSDIDRLNYLGLDLQPGEPGVDVDLAAQTADFAGEPTDELSGIEDVTGSRGDDRLRGDGRTNRLIGGDGDDRIVGRGGFDILLGDLPVLLEDMGGDPNGGDDRINARDGRTDRVECGGEAGDSASLDRSDQASGC